MVGQETSRLGLGTEQLLDLLAQARIGAAHRIEESGPQLRIPNLQGIDEDIAERAFRFVHSISLIGLLASPVMINARNR